MSMACQSDLTSLSLVLRIIATKAVLMARYGAVGCYLHVMLLHVRLLLLICAAIKLLAHSTCFVTAVALCPNTASKAFVVPNG